MPANPTIPRPDNALLNPQWQGRPSNEWYTFWQQLLQFVRENGGTEADIAALEARVAALEADSGADAVIQGQYSVEVLGSLEGGTVTVQLVGDTISPGNTYYYGTGQTGVRGWFTVASALVQGSGITLTVGADGVITIAHADTSSVTNLTSDNANGVVIQDVTQTFDTFGHVLTSTVATKDVWESPVLTGAPVAPTPAAGDNDTSVATTAFVFAAVPNASYRTLMTASSIITAGAATGTYAMVAGGDGCVLSGADTAIPLQTIYIDSADFPTVNAATTKLRIRVQLYTNDTAPTGNYTFGLYPITRPGTSGGSGVNAYTLGTVVTGSDGATFTAPAADGLLNAVGADFALPPNGHYVIGLVTTAVPVANSNIHMNASLQMRNA